MNAGANQTIENNWTIKVSNYGFLIVTENRRFQSDLISVFNECNSAKKSVACVPGRINIHLCTTSSCLQNDLMFPSFPVNKLQCYA